MRHLMILAAMMAGASAPSPAAHEVRRHPDDDEPWPPTDATDWPRFAPHLPDVVGAGRPLPVVPSPAAERIEAAKAKRARKRAFRARQAGIIDTKDTR